MRANPMIRFLPEVPDGVVATTIDDISNALLSWLKRVFRQTSGISNSTISEILVCGDPGDATCERQTVASAFIRSASSDIDDNLANLSVRFEEARRFLDLFKRERARDNRLQLPRSEPHIDEGYCPLQGSFVVRDLPV